MSDVWVIDRFRWPSPNPELCELCEAKFIKVVRPAHHCRRCVKCICGNCSKLTVLNHRVCNQCYKKSDFCQRCGTENFLDTMCGNCERRVCGACAAGHDTSDDAVCTVCAAELKDGPAKPVREKSKAKRVAPIGSNVKYGAALVLDLGSALIKAGYASDELPRVSIPNIIGRYKKGIKSKDPTAVYIGQAARDKHADLALSYPMSHGRVDDWSSLEAVLTHVFEAELLADTTAQPMLLTEPVDAKKVHRAKLAEMMFETFGAPALFLGSQPVLSLYASGRASGVVAEVGDGVTQVVPVFHGIVQEHAIARQDLGGRDITDYLTRLFETDFHQSFSSIADREYVRNIKETDCYSAVDYVGEVAAEDTLPPISYKRPGAVINFGRQRFQCVEALFKPELVAQYEKPGLSRMIYDAIVHCEIDMRKHMYKNIVLSGGSTRFPNLSQRVHHDVKELASHLTKVKVIATQKKEYRPNAWIGGALLCSMPDFGSRWVTRHDWDEIGERCLDKCNYQTHYFPALADQ